MPKIVKVKRSNVAGSTPSVSYGELAYNAADNRLFAGNAANVAVLLNAGSGGGGGSANIVEASTAAGFPAVGSVGTLYHATDVRRIFFWDASGVYVEAGTSGGGGSGSSFTLAAATASELGGVKVGSGLTISDGVLSATGDSVLRALFVPGAPTSVTATAGDAQATVSWTAPSVLAQTPITDYTVQFSTNSGSTWTTVTRAASASASATVTGLTNGTAVVFRVSATNGVGTSSYSTASSAVTPAAGPPIAYAAKFGPGSYTVTGTSTITATVTGGGDDSDTRLWLLIGTSGTLSYTVTASSEDGYDGGALYRTSASPANHSAFSGYSNHPAGMTLVSGTVTGTSTSTGSVAVTSGQHLVLRYAKDGGDSANNDRITAVLNIS
jgi:hypothetical protein